MNIPDDVIEAAAEALVSSTIGDRAGINWEEFFEAARQALNAAAPRCSSKGTMNAAEKAMQDIGDALDAYTSGECRELRALMDISRIVGRYDMERAGGGK